MLAVSSELVETDNPDYADYEALEYSKGLELVGKINHEDLGSFTIELDSMFDVGALREARSFALEVNGKMVYFTGHVKDIEYSSTSNQVFATIKIGGEIIKTS